MRKEGIDFLTFKKVGQNTLTEIDSDKVDQNFNFWKENLGIENDPADEFPDTFQLVNNLLGNHTLPFRIYTYNKNVYPIKEIFNFDNGGLLSHRIRGGSTKYLKTAIELGIDNFVFSYLGTHDPYHRLNDSIPIMPFGLFLDAGSFAFTHGSLRDRDFKKNELVKEEELEYYFLKMEDLRKLITWRINNDPLFAKDFWRYFGKEDYWDDPVFMENHWKNKAEMCFYEIVPLNFIRAILWPIWEEGFIGHNFVGDELQELSTEIKSEYLKIYGKELSITFYRPYAEIIKKDSWSKFNLRDWQYNLIHASCVVQEYFNEHKVFPFSVLDT